jgi:tetratricopeptide (TPR) repeat protein
MWPSLYNKINLYLLVIFIAGTPFLFGQQLAEIPDDPNSFENKFVEANILYHLEKYSEAISVYESLISEDRRNADVAFELARAYEKKGSFQQSYEYVDRAIRFEPKNIWFHLFKVKMLEEDARYIEAADQYTALIELDPMAYEFYKQKANNLSRAGKYEEAAQVLNESEQIHGSFEEIHQRKYDLYMAANMRYEATNEILKLLEIYPENTHYLYLLASHYGQVGEKIMADSVLKIILTLDPSDARAGIALSRQNKKGAMKNEYLNSLQPIFEDPEADLDAKIIELIPFIEKINPTDTALIKTLDHLAAILVKTHPGKAKVHSLYGDILKLSARYEEAIIHYQKAIAFDKSVFQVFDELLFVQYLIGDFKNMLKTAEITLDYYPNQVKIYIWYATALQHNGQNNKALQELDQALLMASGNPELSSGVLIHKAKINLKNNSFTDAIRHFEEAINIAPYKEDALISAIYFLSNHNQTQAAANLIADKYENHFSKNPLYNAVDARLAAILGQTQEALNRIEKIQEVNSIAEIHEFKGDIFLLALGKDAAEKQWKTAIQMGGNQYRLMQKIKTGNIYE